MRDRLELPQLSLAERDRRWSLTRAQMAGRGIDCLVLWGWPATWDFCTANARYLCPVGGNAENNTLIFPGEGEPTSFVAMPTFVQYWKRAQNWVGDIRARRGSWVETVVSRLRDMGLDRARIGMDGLAGPLDPDGWLPHSVLEGIKAALPNAEIVNLGEMMERLRTVKSAEEIAMLDRAARLGDAMLAVCRDRARPGIREAEVYAAMMEAMVAGGGEEPTLFLWACDRHPFPHPFRLPTIRPIEADDLIICEIHPKTGGYFTHVERTYCVGTPDPNAVRIYRGCVDAFEAAMAEIGPGRSISGAMAALKAVVEEAELGICEAGIHGHGLASLEYPRYRFHALHADQAAIARTGDRFEAGMVFALNLNLFDPKWRDGATGASFGETVVITEDGARRMHGFSKEFQTIGGP